MKTIKRIARKVWKFIACFYGSFIGLSFYITIMTGLYLVLFHLPSMAGETGIKILAGICALMLQLYLQAVIEDLKNTIAYYRS